MGGAVENRVVGVDPGLSGGIALLDGDRIKTWPMPIYKIGRKRVYDLEMIANLIAGLTPQLIVVEQVTRPATLTRCQGVIMGIALGLYIPFKTVRPQVWRPFLSLAAGEGKDKSILKAIELFPELSATITRKNHDGEAEAALIAWWGSKQ